jgi:hypothetical protein
MTFCAEMDRVERTLLSAAFDLAFDRALILT